MFVRSTDVCYCYSTTLLMFVCTIAVLLLTVTTASCLFDIPFINAITITHDRSICIENFLLLLLSVYFSAFPSLPLMTCPYLAWAFSSSCKEDPPCTCRGHELFSPRPLAGTRMPATGWQGLRCVTLPFAVRATALTELSHLSVLHIARHSPPSKLFSCIRHLPAHEA